MEQVNPKDLAYDFTKDSTIQAIAQDLFKNGNHIAESTNPSGKHILSFLLVEDVLYRSRYDQLTPKNSSILIYPEFNEAKDCYDIVIVITIFNKRTTRSYDYVLLGETDKQKKEQIDFLKTVLEDKPIIEIWFRGRVGEVANWLAPVNQIELSNKSLLKKIIKWNSIDLKTCIKCGKKLPRFSSEPICSDCYSKEVAIKNHFQ